MKFILTAVSSCLLMLLAACAASTEGIPSVQGLDIPRYMGKWYEIARMPHSFERNMDYVTADYTLNEENSAFLFSAPSTGITGSLTLLRITVMRS